MKISPPTPPGMSPAPERGLFNPSEMKRVRAMVFALVLVVAGLIYVVNWYNKAQNESSQAQQALPEQAPPEEVVVTPTIDKGKLESLVHDATPGERALLEPAALAQGLAYAALVRDSLYEPMGGRPLDAKVVESLLADPAAGRGDLFRARGWLESAQRYEKAGDVPAHARVLLRLEDGGFAWFAILDRDDQQDQGLLIDDFVRLDGLFVEDYRAEGAEDGTFIDAPLLASPRVVRSFPRMEPVTELDPAVFDEVQDDSFEHGLHGQPFEAFWQLVSYVRNLPPDAVDWSKTPVLNRDTLAQLELDGARFRVQPMRIPVCQVMDAWAMAQKENPLRIEKLTEGWLGSNDWTTPPAHGLIHFASPFLFPDVHRKDEIIANGFFLKHLSYAQADGGIAVAPFFVLQSIDVHTPPPDTVWKRFLIAFTVGIVVLGCVIAFSMARDRKRSAELQQELLERRRARRHARVPS